MHTAVTFDVFLTGTRIRSRMANVAQTIQLHHSLFLRKGTVLCAHRFYYSLKMYRNHMDRNRTDEHFAVTNEGFPRARRRKTIAGAFWLSVYQRKSLTVTLTNPSLDSPVATHIRLASGKYCRGRGSILTHADDDAAIHLTSNEVRLAPFPQSRFAATELSLRFPQRAVVRLHWTMT